MKASLANAASLFQAPLTQTARLVEALREQVEARTPGHASDSQAETGTSAGASDDTQAEAATSVEAPDNETDPNEG